MMLSSAGAASRASRSFFAGGFSHDAAAQRHARSRITPTPAAPCSGVLSMESPATGLSRDVVQPRVILLHLLPAGTLCPAGFRDSKRRRHELVRLEIVRTSSSFTVEVGQLTECEC